MFKYVLLVTGDDGRPWTEGGEQGSADMDSASLVSLENLERLQLCKYTD